MTANITTVGALAKHDFTKEILPMRVATKRDISLPNEFLVTGIDVVPGDQSYLNYYCPKSQTKASVYVSNNLRLEAMIGTEGDELLRNWQIERVGAVGRRLSCTLGTDPEVFVVDKKGFVIPAWEYLPSKDKPIAFDYANGGYSSGTAYWDGFQAEFTTQANVRCLLWVSDNVYIGLKTIYEKALKVGGRLTIDNVVPVTPNVLATAKDEHVQFGCAPSFNAYGLVGRTENGRTTPYRFAGGHLHFGIVEAKFKTKEYIERYVRALDMILGVASVSLLGELDSPIRRRYYGLPGEYRTPKHGFEYRTLSNAWMCHPLAMNMVFDLARSVCGLAQQGLLDGWAADQDETLEIILNNDVAKAREVLHRNKKMFKQVCKVMGYYYSGGAEQELAYKVWSHGIDSVVEDPKDIVGNWNLKRGWVSHGDGVGKNWEKAYAKISTGQKV